MLLQVSVPRRGFRSLLLKGSKPIRRCAVGFSPPKGIQVFVTCHRRRRLQGLCGFQSPEGDSGLCYINLFRRLGVDPPGFSPPKGIQVFVTPLGRCGD